MAAPEFTVEIGFTSSLANLLVFPFSFVDVDGTAQTLGVFGNAFSNWFDGTYDNVSQYVDGEITIRRGRDDLLTTMQAGTCSITLCDPSDAGKFNPQNADSVIVQESPGLVPMRPVRISATYSGTTYRLFYGFIQAASYSMDGTVGKLQIDCVDLFMWLSRVRPQDPDAFTGGAPTQEGDTATVTTATEVGTVSLDQGGFVRTVGI